MDGCRFPRNNLQLKGNQRIEKNKIKEDTIWPFLAYENGCNCTYRYSGTGGTYNLPEIRGAGRSDTKQ